jgi:predicted O-methyltransferase YrrM
MEFIEEALAKYATAHSSEEPAILKKLSRETHLKMMQSRMLSGHIQGRLLSLLSHLTRPKCILEIGTYTGYSAICLAEGLAEEGILHTIDNNPERDAFVNRFVEEAEMTNKIRTYIGDARKVIPTITGDFDIVFIDADKSGYAEYYDLIIDRIKPGGIIITDNVLWSGKVIEPVKANDDDTLLIQAFNKKIASDPRVEVVLLPIRDGISIARKIETGIYS